MEYLAHHGIKGQKWGVRRYQNADGSLTAEGRKRYESDIKKGYRDVDGYLTAIGRVAKDPRNKEKGVKGLFRLEDYEVNPKNNAGKKSFEQLKKDYPGLDSNSKLSENSYDKLSEAVSETSGDWYFSEGKSPAFKRQLKVIKDITKSPEYGYGVKWCAQDDLVGVVLNDLGYQDTSAARKYIHDVVIYD